MLLKLKSKKRKHRLKLARKSKSMKTDLRGKKGVAISKLCLVGFIEVEGRRYDARSIGGPIQKGETVIIIKREMGQWIVKTLP